MRAFVTGATGLLGSNLVGELRRRGHEVRALVRSPEKAEQLLGGLGAEVVQGDIQEVARFAEALRGCDVVFHTAAYFREYYSAGDHWPMLERINVQATLELVEAARARGVSRFVDTSSSGVIGAKPDGSPGDESCPPGPVSLSNLYFRSKVVLWDKLKALHAQSGYPTLSVLPGWMFGPSDAAPTGSGRLVLDALAQKLPGIPPGGGSIADARDVAAGMIAAAERGQPGERYILGGHDTDLAEVFQLIEKVSGVPQPQRRIPYPVALSVAAVAQTVARLRGKASTMSVEGVRTLAARKLVSSARAMRELGATFRPLEETLRDEVAWYRANGFAPSVTRAA